MILPVGDEIKFPEMWVPFGNLQIPGAKDQYQISTWGRIYNEFTKTYLPKNIYYSKDKYISTSLSGFEDNDIMIQIHRAVLKTFCPIDNDYLYDVNHIDGVKYHNWIWNLEWTTHEENMHHAVKNNLFSRGEQRSSAKITNEQAIRICELLDSGKTPREVAEIMQLENCNGYRMAKNIKQGHSWTFISSNYNFRKINNGQI